MPTLNAFRDDIISSLDTISSDEEFEQLCFNFGIELDEVTNDQNNQVVYKIDLPANRYDLLSVEGLLFALKIFLGQIEPPSELKIDDVGYQSMFDQMIKERPVLTEISYLDLKSKTHQSLIELIDKLHLNLARKKTIFVIELSITPEGGIVKKPLEMDASKIQTDDLKGVTMSINISGTNFEKQTIALNMIIYMLMNSSSRTELTKVYKYKLVPTDKKQDLIYTTPNLKYREETIETSHIAKALGIVLKDEQVVELLKKMAYSTKIESPGVIKLGIPPIRCDVINKSDVIEDVAIAYGYNNLPRVAPKNPTIGEQMFLNKLSDQLRHESARCGFTEALNFALCSIDELKTLLRRDTLDDAVHIGNPKTFEFQVARTLLLPGLLKTLNSNKQMPLPVKLFEIGDVVIKDASKDVKAVNKRHLAAIYYGKKNARFEIIHGFLDRIMQVLNISTVDYCIKGSENRLYLDGRSATVFYKGNEVGSLGVLHPEILHNFELNMPSSSLEIDIEKLATLSSLC